MKAIYLKSFCLILAISVLLCIQTIFAQVGAKITDPDNGFSYNIPEGWSQQGSENGAVSFTKNGDNNHIIIVSPHQYSEVQQVLQEANQPQQLGELTLALQGTPQAYGSNGVFAYYAGEAQGTRLHLQTIMLVSPYGGGVLVAGISVADEPPAYILQACKALAVSVHFSKPQVSALALQWTQALRGVQLIYLKTANGLSQKSSYDLCIDGSFYFSSDENYSSNTFTDSFNSAITGGGQGTWKVVSQGQDVLLLFSFKDGSRRQFTLTTDADYLYLNGVKYFRQKAQNCE